MLRLCGFHISNYHNKVRIALLEKGVEPFEEDATCKPSQEEEFLARSRWARCRSSSSTAAGGLPSRR